jgi:hypothetical protein
VFWTSTLPPAFSTRLISETNWSLKLSTFFMTARTAPTDASSKGNLPPDDVTKKKQLDDSGQAYNDKPK